MISVRTLLVGATLAAACALTGCGPYGMKGDRGLPPPPETMAYPNVNLEPAPTDGRPVKSTTEQERLKQNLLASRPRVARSPAPFDAQKTLREQQEKARRASQTR